MPPRSDIKSDLVRIRHIVDAIEESLGFIKDLSRNDLEKDRKLALALVKEIEVIGEAASKISNNFSKKNNMIPWDIMVATKNRLVHGYFDIDYDTVWSTLEKDLPSILPLFKKLL
jgi:uncharacterized protein with HEPN domain